MSEPIDRRDFLGQAAAGSVALGAAVRSSLAAETAPNQKVVVGVMGLSRGLGLAKVFAGQPGVEVKYCCDVDVNRAQKGASEVAKIAENTPQAVQELQKVLDDKDVTALVCAAPNHWHAPATILALKAGKHVYVEKPCCHNPREGELMVEAARKYSKAVQMGTQRRSSPKIIEAIQQLHDGVIGRVYLAKSWYTNARPSIGFGKPAEVPPYLNYELWQGPAPRQAYLDNRVPYNWHWFWHYGNGELGNNGVHSLDVCRWGMQTDYPIRVTSSGGRYHWEDDQQTPDTHTVCFEFDGRKQITWEGRSCNKHKIGSGFVTFYGDNGSLDIEGGGTYTIYDVKDKVVKTEKGTGGEPEHIANFVAAIRNDKPLELNQEILSGHKSTLLCHLGNIAHRTGRTITCQPSDGHILDDKEAMTFWSREYEKGWEPTV